MFKYGIKVFSPMQNKEIDFKIIAKNDKEAIKKANELYFKCFLLNVSKFMNGSYLIIKKFN
jgi:hypothetical protein